jgi:hypothetical protein
MSLHLKPDKIEKHSGFQPSLSSIEILKKHEYFVTDQAVSGDAPKKFIRHYEFGHSAKRHRHKWPAFIAKTGHKWYPIESITEFLLNRLGETLGIRMAKSKLAYGGSQIRFLSKYFLAADESLVHGAQIYSGYLGDDPEFVEQIERNKLAKEWLTLQITQKALLKFFPLYADAILEDLVRMLLFDAWVGNNDRHFYNWGVVTDIKGRKKPYFSPVYDTARGLFWNFAERKIVSLHKNANELERQIQNYISGSCPKIGWDSEVDINHIRLVEQIAKFNFGIKRDDIRSLFGDDSLKKCEFLIQHEFDGLLSPERKYVILHCLQRRIEEIRKVI